MDHHVCLKRALLTRSGGLNNQLAGAFFNTYDFRAELNVNPKLTTTLHNLIDQVRVKERKGARSSMDDCDLRSGTHRHMSEFKRDIPTSNEQNPLGKLIQLQELFARREIFRSGNLQVGRFLSGCDDYIPPFQHIVVHLNGGRANESSAAMERRDPSFRKPLFPVFGNRLNERALEAHQFLPINPKLLGPNPFPFHSADPIKGFRSADKNLFRVASPERARPPERP